jgi:hypothetical protein
VRYFYLFGKTHAMLGDQQLNDLMLRVVAALIKIKGQQQ